MIYWALNQIQGLKKVQGSKRVQIVQIPFYFHDVKRCFAKGIKTHLVLAC